MPRQADQEDMKMSGKIIVVANQKGGTAKTTTSYNLGEGLRALGRKVLLVDLDPQANLTTLCGIDEDKCTATLYDLLMAVLDDRKLPVKESYIVCKDDALHVIPGSINLAAAEIRLRDELGGEKTLSMLLDTLRDDYDYIILDTNPYLGLLTINALAAADRVIIPASPQLWSATGLTNLLKVIDKVRRKINPNVEISGILITMAAMRTVLYRNVVELIEKHFDGSGIKIFDTKIPLSTKIGEANYYSQSVADFAGKEKAGESYLAFAKEFLKCEEEHDYEKK
jgi:chromosome partitioning protein